MVTGGAAEQPTEADVTSIDDRHLRSALEFAVHVAGEAQKRKPALAYPKPLKPHLYTSRLPTSALGKIRRAVESDRRFRERIAAGALPEVVDEIGRLWLSRPEGWERRVGELIERAEAEARSRDAERELRRAERRRRAAEEAATRVAAESVRLASAVEELLARVSELEQQLDAARQETAATRAETVEARTAARHARDREASARARLADLEADHAAAERTDHPPERELLNALREVVARTVEELGGVADALASAADDADPDAIADVSADGSPSTVRVPLRLPGGTSGDTREAVEHLLGSGAAIFIDGYNVSMTAWSDQALTDQRALLIDAVEGLAARFDTSPTIVFDGSTVVGGHTTARRRTRVVYSPEGVSADDVIRREVARVEPSVPVVVVTSDAEIVRDVKAMGANVVTSTLLTSLF